MGRGGAGRVTGSFLLIVLAAGTLLASAQPRASGPGPPNPAQRSAPAGPAAPQGPKPTFPESYEADLEQQLIKVDGKPIRDGEIVESTVYYDRKRHAERVDVHTYQTSYLFLYGQGKAYMTSAGSCFTAVLTRPILSPKLPASAEFVGTEPEVNGVPEVEHWKSNVPIFTTPEDLWVKRQGREFWPVAELSTRGRGREEMQIRTMFKSFYPERLDPTLFKAPPPGSDCQAFPGEQFDRAMEHRNTLHFNPVFIPHNKPVDMVPRDFASGGVVNAPPNVRRPPPRGSNPYQRPPPDPTQQAPGGMRWQ